MKTLTIVIDDWGDDDMAKAYGQRYTARSADFSYRGCVETGATKLEAVQSLLISMELKDYYDSKHKQPQQ